ncbi:MAG: sigma-70 family RNA polymerase sigma factor [Muribaculaceae bacterium]|nr:sigma-70 family RNA polymerase sigma factor [Muribaculaceae bacterium]
MNTNEYIFKSRYLPLYPLLYRIAYSILGSEADASDAVQETMVKIWSIGDGMDSIGNPQAYASKTLRTTSIDILRRRRYTADIDSAEMLSDTLSCDSEDIDSVDFLMKAIESLPAGQQEVMRLSACAGLPTDEIARATGFTNENVRQLLSRARKKLRTIFKSA